MTLLERLADKFPDIPDVVRLKAAILFSGVQYDPCLADAGQWAFPNFMPYHLPPGMPAYRGKRVIETPYLFRFGDDTQVRLRIKEGSAFTIVPAGDDHVFDILEAGRVVGQTSFEPRQDWTRMLTADGTPMKSTGLSQHGEMLVLNVAPGCEYFVVPDEDTGRTQNLSCSFCLYGLPDKRLETLGQELYVIDVPRPTIDRVIEACAHETTDARQLYIVGGSMLDMEAEGVRYVQIARRLAEAGLTERYYVAAGSGAIRRQEMAELKALGVRGACFNMEVWDRAQFKRICPGKDKIVGRDRWIESLEDAVDIFGPDHVMTAFVGGAELHGEGAMSDPSEALDSALEAGEYLIPRGIQALYSLFWKVTGKNRGEEPAYTLDFFLELGEQLCKIRRRENRLTNPDFISKRSAYMQLEPDFDAAYRALE
ncbi:MAG: radical SAM protein [Myxococcota bacterium]|nr:radical SAM protein [Myxococcota bacterium]